MRIGVFGGSFDPIHHGHLIAAVTLRESLGLDQVRLVVAREQPLKGGSHRATPEHRATMAELGAARMSGLEVDRRELLRNGPSYTVDTLRELEREHPGAELVLVLGSDAAAGLDRWHESGAIQSLARITVFSRAGGGAGAGAVKVPRVDISSTEIRARVRAGRTIRYWVPEAVADYIAARRLYGADSSG